MTLLRTSLVLLAMTTACHTFNPMDLYVDRNEGVSLAFTDKEQKFTYCWGFELLGLNARKCEGATFKSEALDQYTRILVGPPKSINIYPMRFYYSDIAEENKLHVVDEDIQVHKNNDGTVSLSCSNGKYVTWGTDTSEGSWYAYNQDGIIPMCLEDGICPHCRFTLVVGSITDIQISLVDISWGNPEEAIPSKPSQVAEDHTQNYSEAEIETKLSVSYTNEVSDTTLWEHAWGFEFSVSAEADVNIPFIGGGSVTTTATASYNGKYGTENTETKTESFGAEKTVICKPRKRCILKYVASKLDDYNIPFIATVQRTQDNGPPLQWQESGVWRGVQAFNFETVYCTEDLDTGESNCPTFDWME